MIDNYVEHTVFIKRVFCVLLLQQLNGTVGDFCTGGGGGQRSRGKLGLLSVIDMLSN